MKKIVTSVKIPDEINKKMILSVVNKGYGLRGKSRWIEEAISNLLKMKDFEDFVDIATEQEQLSKSLSFRLSEPLAVDLDRAVIKVRTKFPAMEAARSNIVRAAIMQHLLR